ncbi:MAG: class I SAM-dependent methyltransferase [Acidobacteria bacterium]|nr:class I SAM-dependent methyltransferase [Acidobacteriota bacterium]
MSSFPQQLSRAIAERWREESARGNSLSATGAILRELYGFVRDSTPERRRSRYGDMDYDWEHRVNTTSGSVGWQERLLGVFHSAYQPTDAEAFHEMMAALPIDFGEFTFIDIGSGKGRTLLMASAYPFRRIIGVELLPELHRAAAENIAVYRNDDQRCKQIESLSADAREFEFPLEPLVVYLFNPLPSAGLERLLANLGESLQHKPRAVYVVYHNPLLKELLETCAWLTKVGNTTNSVIYRNSAFPQNPP